MHIKNPGPDRSQKLPAHKVECIVLLVKARGVEKHHLHKAGWGICEFLQPQQLGEAGNGPQRALEEPVLDLRAGRVALVEKRLAEVHAAQNELIVGRHFVQLHVGTRVLDVCLHQGRAYLNVLDQHFFLQDGPIHEGGLFWGKQACLFVFWLVRVRAGHTQSNDQEGEGDLPKSHVKLLDGFVQILLQPLAPARRLTAYYGSCTLLQS